MVTALERTFGFELEVADGATDLAHALTEAGVCRSGSRHQWHCRCEDCDMLFGEQGNWLKVQNDSSCGGEAISSILRWGNTGSIVGRSPAVNPQYLIDVLCDTMIANDVPIDARCGLHVHVGATDLTDNQLGRLYALMHHYEAILYRLACGRSERHRGYDNNFNYCRPMSGFDNPVEAKELAWLKSSQVKSSPIAYNKYVMANMVPIDSLGTVEFRLWEATRSRRRLRMYAKLSVALVQRAKLRNRPAGEPFYLGDAPDESVLMEFIEDIQRAAPQLLDDEFVEDIQWQWQEGPARWQRAVNLPPLPHQVLHGGYATTADEVVVEQYDSHSRPIHVPPQYDLLREERERLMREQQQAVYVERCIPEHLRPMRRVGGGHMEDANYDCGYGYCTHDTCRENRRVFWTNAESGNVRDPRAERAAEETAQQAALRAARDAIRQRRARSAPRPVRMEEPEPAPFPVDPPAPMVDEQIREAGRLMSERLDSELRRVARNSWDRPDDDMPDIDWSDMAFREEHR